jgi:hypothetical protein
MTETVTVGSVTLGPQTDLVSLLRRQMLEGSVWSVFRDQGPEEGLDWAMAAVQSTSLESRMTDAVMQLLLDADRTVRSRSVILAKSFASRFSSEDLLQLLEEHPELFEGVKPSTGGDDPDLAWGLLEAMSGHPVVKDRVRDRLRKAALDPQEGSRVLAALTRDDRDWVLQHATQLVAGNSLNAEIILANLAEAAHRQAFVQQFRTQSINTRRVISAAIDATIEKPDERSRLKALTSHTP